MVFVSDKQETSSVKNDPKNETRHTVWFSVNPITVGVVLNLSDFKLMDKH